MHAEQSAALRAGIKNLKDSIIELSKFAVSLEKAFLSDSAQTAQQDTQGQQTGQEEQPAALDPVAVREKIRQAAMNAIALNKKADVRQILADRGARKIDELPEDQLLEVQALVEALGHAA